MKPETKTKIAAALAAIAQLRANYPLDGRKRSRPDELEVYEIEVLNEGKIYEERKNAIVFLVRALAKHTMPEARTTYTLWDITCTLQDLFNRCKRAKNPRVSLHAALNHMEQQLQEFLINGLYDELQECFQ